MGHLGCLLSPGGHPGLLKASQRALDTWWRYPNRFLVVQHNYLLSDKDFLEIQDSEKEVSSSEGIFPSLIT